MMVRRERLPQPEFFHYREAGAIGEGKILIPEPKENRSRFFSSLHPDTFPLQPRTALHLTPPGLSGRQTQANAEQRQSLINYVL